VGSLAFVGEIKFWVPARSLKRAVRNQNSLRGVLGELEKALFYIVYLVNLHNALIWTLR
jgi:hypothetical protein